MVLEACNITKNYQNAQSIGYRLTQTSVTMEANEVKNRSINKPKDIIPSLEILTALLTFSVGGSFTLSNKIEELNIQFFRLHSWSFMEEKFIFHLSPPRLPRIWTNDVSDFRLCAKDQEGGFIFWNLVWRQTAESAAIQEGCSRSTTGRSQSVWRKAGLSNVLRNFHLGSYVLFEWLSWVY